MEDSTSKRWTPALIIGSILGSVFVLAYLSVRLMPSNTNMARASRPLGSKAYATPYRNAQVNWTAEADSASLQRVKRESVLYRDRVTRIGKSIVTYRGKASKKTIRLDVTIPELDPEVTYSRIINIANARNGFQLGDKSFELISVNKLRLYVRHYDYN